MLVVSQFDMSFVYGLGNMSPLGVKGKCETLEKLTSSARCDSPATGRRREHIQAVSVVKPTIQITIGRLDRLA